MSFAPVGAPFPAYVNVGSGSTSARDRASWMGTGIKVSAAVALIFSSIVLAPVLPFLAALTAIGSMAMLATLCPESGSSGRGRFSMPSIPWSTVASALRHIGPRSGSGGASSGSIGGYGGHAPVGGGYPTPAPSFPPGGVGGHVPVGGAPHAPVHHPPGGHGHVPVGGGTDTWF